MQYIQCPAGGTVSPGQDVTPQGPAGGGGVKDRDRVTAKPPEHQWGEVKVLQLQHKHTHTHTHTHESRHLWWSLNSCKHTMSLSLWPVAVGLCRLRCWGPVGPRWCSAPCLIHTHTPWRTWQPWTSNQRGVLEKLTDSVEPAALGQEVFPWQHNTQRDVHNKHTTTNTQGAAEQHNHVSPQGAAEPAVKLTWDEVESGFVPAGRQSGNQRVGQTTLEDTWRHTLRTAQLHTHKHTHTHRVN